MHLHPCSRRREVNSIAFLVLFYTNFPKNFDDAKQSKTATKCLHFTVEFLTLFVYQAWVEYPDRIDAFQGLLASLFLLSSKRLLCLCISSNFLHRLSWRFWLINSKRLKITESWLKVCNAYLFGRGKSGAGDHQKPRKAPGTLDSAVLLPFVGCKIYYGCSRYGLKWCNFLSWCFNVLWRVPCHRPYTLLPVITWMPDSMSPIPILLSLVINLF